MKRAALVGAGTLAGVAAILAVNPEAGTAASSAAAAGVATGISDTGSTGSSGSGTTSGSTGSGTSTTSGVTDGAFTGDAVDVGRNYGTVQVEVTVTGGRLVDVTALAVPQNDPRSSQISDYSVPQLVQQALSAQTADIAGLSGATYTSNGFAQSLRSALVQAGLAS